MVEEAVIATKKVWQLSEIVTVLGKLSKLMDRWDGHERSIRSQEGGQSWEM